MTVHAQLELFQGAHVPLLRCLAALDRADLRAAREALSGGSEADGARLAALDARLAPGATPDPVHAAFETALGPAREPGQIPDEVWFRLYARSMGASLASEPGRRFRGWGGLHFEWAAGDAPGALRRAQALIAACRAGWAWQEAARMALAAGAAEQGTRWLAIACLATEEGLDPAPPRLEPAGATALNGPADPLPRFPPAIEDLWGEVEALELPDPASAWVPSVLVIDGVLAPSLLGWTADLSGSGVDLLAPPPPDELVPRAFFRALLLARQARALEPPAAGVGYGAAELAARRRMRDLAPPLLERYLSRLSR